MTIRFPGTVWRDFCVWSKYMRGGGEGISNRRLFLPIPLNSCGKTYLHFSFPSSRPCQRPSVKLTWPPTSVKQSTSDRRSSVESEYHGLRLFLPRRGYPITMLTVDRHLTLRRMKSNSGLSIFYLLKGLMQWCFLENWNAKTFWISFVQKRFLKLGNCLEIFIILIWVYQTDKLYKIKREKGRKKIK